ncbi:MAG TPA: hypothetical protein VJ921_02365 [Vicinamibacteria bacterium]|nr:hypothetical protein [Vicinamibacteria bacterium]
MTPARAILSGTLTVAVLDILDAFVFAGLRGVAPIRVLQGIASGLLGRESFDGGGATALLGACIHVFISFSVVSVYSLASARLSFLTRRPWIFGPLYGLLVYLFMYRVVLPLSASAGPKYTPVSVANQLFAHLFLVGLPAALFARAGRW